MKMVLERLQAEFGPAILATSDFRGDETALVRPESAAAILRYLKEDLGFNMLLDICGVDYLRHKIYPAAADERFEVVYHLYSVTQKYRVRIKARLTEGRPEIPTVCGLWKAADWFEREAYDMFGIIFKGHPNLKRILTYPEFEGHPLRKDYPITRRSPIPTPDTLLDELEKARGRSAE